MGKKNENQVFVEKKRQRFIEKYCGAYLKKIEKKIKVNYPLLPLNIFSQYKMILFYTVNQILLPTLAYCININKEKFSRENTSYYDYLFSLEYSKTWEELNQYTNIEKKIKDELDNRINGVLIILELLYHDLILIKKMRIKQIFFNLGDMHVNGTSTTIIKFEDNSKIVFKPVQCKVDIDINNIINWINNELPLYLLKTRKIVDMNGYAYKEFITHNNEIGSISEIKEFYYRMGKLLALGSILHINDGHMENIITHGKYPVWIDLESSFSTLNKVEKDNLKSYVENTLLLQDANYRPGEFSIVSGIQGGTTKNKSWVAAFPINDGTDNLQVRYRKLSNANADNRLIYNNVIVDPEDYESSIIDGFTDVSELILKKREEFWIILKEILSNKDLRLRVILRATVFYSIVKCRSYQPLEIINGTYWEYVKDYLSSSENYEKDYNDEFRIFIANSELNDLKKGLVPIFYRDLYTRRLYNSEGNYIENFYDSDVYSYFKDFIEKFDCSFIENNIIAIKRCLESTRKFDYEKDIENWSA